jgi:hypothetical protein
MKKRYRSIPKAVKLGFTVDVEADVSHAMDTLEVIDTPPLTVHTGLLDAAGNEIVYDVPTMGPIGFIHFPDPDPDEEEDY